MHNKRGREVSLAVKSVSTFSSVIQNVAWLRWNCKRPKSWRAKISVEALGVKKRDESRVGDSRVLIRLQ